MAKFAPPPLLLHLAHSLARFVAELAPQHLGQLLESDLRRETEVAVLKVWSRLLAERSLGEEVLRVVNISEILLVLSFERD